MQIILRTGFNKKKTIIKTEIMKFFIYEFKNLSKTIK